MKKLIFALIILLLIPSLVYAFPPWSNRLNAVNVWTGTNTFSGTLSVTGLTDGYVPYHVNDTSGLANSPILINTYGIQFADDKASLGLGAVASQYSGIYEVKDTTVTDLTYRSIHSTNTYRTTANGTFTRQGVYMTMSPLISSGVTDSGTVGGFDYYVERAFKGAAYDDIGTLALLYGGSISYGHNNIGDESNPTTTTAYGLRILPFAELGTIDTMYDFYIGALSTGGTVTNRWGIYQADTAPNYFAGDITLAGGNLNTGNIPLIIGDNTTDSITLRTDGGDVTVPEGTITLLDTTTAALTYQPLDANLSNKAAGTDSDYARDNWKTSEPTVAQGLTVIADGINWDPDSTSVDKAAAITISFNEDGATDYILDSANGLGVFSVGQAIKVAGSTESDGTYVITAVAAGQLTLTATTDNLGGDEDAGDSVTLTANWPSRFQYNGSQWVKLDNIMGVKYASSIIISGITLGDTSPDAEGEVGYASNQLDIHDGTASRDILQVASTTITKSEVIPIIWAEDGADPPAAAAEVSSDLIARLFREDADEDVYIWWQLPLDYSAGIKYRVYYAIDTDAEADETVVFSMSGIAVADSESLAGAVGDPVLVTDELTTDYDDDEMIISPWSGEVTLGGTPVAGEMVKLYFERTTGGDDDYDEADDNVLVAFIEIKYQAKVNASGDY